MTQVLATEKLKGVNCGCWSVEQKMLQLNCFTRPSCLGLMTGKFAIIRFYRPEGRINDEAVKKKPRRVVRGVGNENQQITFFRRRSFYL
jgi:hypothetical protein